MATLVYTKQQMPVVKGRLFFKGSYDLERNIIVNVEGKAPTYHEFENVVDQIHGSSMHFACSAAHTSAEKAVELFKIMGHDVKHHQDTMAFRMGKLYHYTGD
jgi:hypothetical protein